MTLRATCLHTNLLVGPLDRDDGDRPILAAAHDHDSDFLSLGSIDHFNKIGRFLQSRIAGLDQDVVLLELGLGGRTAFHHVGHHQATFDAQLLFGHLGQFAEGDAEPVFARQCGIGEERHAGGERTRIGCFFHDVFHESQHRVGLLFDDFPHGGRLSQRNLGDKWQHRAECAGEKPFQP